MKIETCKTCTHFGLMHVTGDTRHYPCCRLRNRKATWDVRDGECKYEKRGRILPKEEQEEWEVQI